MISKLAMLAKKTIEAAWLNGEAYDLATQAAEALESAQLLQSPETAAELVALRERSTAAPATLPPEQRAVLAEQIGNAVPARDSLLLSLGESIRGRREHEHPTWEDLYCLNLVSWMGERMGPVLRRLLDAEARVAELERIAPTQALREDEPFVPRTERSRWEDIAAALNAAHAAGMPVGIDLDGTLTDRRMWSVVWLSTEERWTVAGWEDDAAVSEADAPALVIYRASWDTMRLGRYTTESEARKHCEDHARRDLPTASFDWIEDEEDGVAELVATVDGNEGPTGYTVTALEIASKYDPEADE